MRSNHPVIRIRRWSALAILTTVVLGAAWATQGAPVTTVAAAANDTTVTPVLHQDTSSPLRSLPSAPRTTRKVPHHGAIAPSTAGTASTPSRTASVLSPATSTTFEGISDSTGGCGCVPPDPDGAAGPSNYVEIVNSSIGVYDKSGVAATGFPKTTNTIWSGFGGGCQANNDGDGVVLYDRAAGRWLVSQFSESSTPFLLCVAISTSGDPTGSYFRYSFSTGSRFPDYPKIGIWSDGYYLTTNDFSGNTTTFLGPTLHVLNRTAMLAGPSSSSLTMLSKSVAANNQGFPISWLPGDNEGNLAPPPGEAELLAALGSDTSHIDFWKASANFGTSTLTFSGPTAVAVPAYVQACGGGQCVPQCTSTCGSANTTNQLDSLGDRLMFRLDYRNFGDHESLVVDHSVCVSSCSGVAPGPTGMRWYEFRTPSSPTLFQSGTFAPDSAYRWLGSVAQDGSGDIAMGYSVSSSTLVPGIRYTVRTPADAAGTMETEATLSSGAGTQSGGGTAGQTRWGDYSNITVDPADGCTFWYVNEYEPAGTGNFNWHTAPPRPPPGTSRSPRCRRTRRR